MLPLRNVISIVTLRRSCIGVVSRNTCKTVNLSALNYYTSVLQQKQSRNTSKIVINTMRPQVFLTRSDFPATGSDLLRNE